MNSKKFRHVPAHSNQIYRLNKFPLWKSAICVVLTFVLAFGLGTNLSYASEFLPKAPEPEYVTLLQTDSKTLNAPQDGSSYMWQIKLAESDTFVTIPEASDRQFTFNAGLIDNEDVLKDGVATLRCNVVDENGEWTAQQLYEVTYLKTLDRLMADNSDEIADALQNPVEYQEVNSSSDIENAETCEISVQYYSGSQEYPVVVGDPIKQSFGKTEDFKWTIQSKTYLGKINSVAIKDPSHQEDLNITWDVNSITIKYNNRELPDNIEIAVYAGDAEARYTIQQYLQNLDQTAWDLVFNEERTGSIGSYVPSNSKGEREISGGIRVQEIGMNIKADNTAKAEVYFTRKYTLAEFDTTGCVQGPEPRYNMYGKTMYEPNEIVEVSDGVWSPGPVPVKIGFTFKGWYIDDDTKILTKSDWEQMEYQSENVTFNAKWEQDSEIADVTIYYYGQNAEQIGSEEDPDYIDKNYSWIAERYEDGNVGEGYYLNDEQVCPRYSPDDESEYKDHYPEYFQCGSGKLSQAAKIVDSSTDPDIVVKNDGSTFVKVYLKRNVYEWKFYDAGAPVAPEWRPPAPTDENQKVGDSIKARWGQDISEQFKDKCKLAYGESTESYPWWIFHPSDPNNPYESVSLMVYMDRENRNTFDYCFTKCYMKYDISHARYYTQNLGKEFSHNPTIEEEDDTENFTKSYDSAAFTTAKVSMADFINIVGFDAPSYKDGLDAPKLNYDEEKEIWTDGDAYGEHGFSFYYKRHTHKLYLAYIQGDGEGQAAVYRIIDNVPYDLPLKDVPVETENGTVPLSEYTPEKYAGVDPYYVFAGWTLDSNTDEGEIIDWETDNLTMQDYDSNIFAKWVAPKVSVSLDNHAPFQQGQKVTSLDEHYGSNISVTIPDIPEDSSGRYVFKSWYYLKDVHKDDEPSNRVYFDPYNMLIPAEVINRASGDKLDMELKLEYTDTELCSYKINYIYQFGSTSRELATPTEGAGKVGSENKFTVYPKPTTELYPEYAGMYTPNPETPSIEITLSYNETNEYTFYYDLTGSFKYKVEYWDTVTNQSIYTKEVLDYSEGRTVTEKALESSDEKIGLEYTLDDDVYKTIVLVADDSAETWNNVIRFNYKQKTTELHYQVSSSSSENGGTLERHDEEKQTIDQDGFVHEANVPIKTTDKAIGVTAVPKEDWQFEYWYATLSGQRVEGWTSTSANLEPSIVVAGENWKAYTFVAVFSYKVFEVNITNHFKDDDTSLENTGGIRLVQNIDGQDRILLDVTGGKTLSLQVTNTSTYAYKYDKDATNKIRETIYMTDVRYQNEDGEWVKGSGQFMIVAYDHTGAKYEYSKWQLNNEDATVALDKDGQVIPVSFDKTKDYSFDAYYQRRYFTLTTVAGDNGSITPAGSVGDLTIPFGEKLTFDNNQVIFSEKTGFNLQGDADEHYVFDHWGIKEAGKDEVTASGEFTFVSNTILTAYFSLEKHKTTYKVADADMGYLTNDDDGNFDYGTSYSVSGNVLIVGDKQISAIANNGYKFEKWCLQDSEEAITSGIIEGETNFVAHFVEGDSFDITYIAIYWKDGTETVRDFDGRAGTISGTNDGKFVQTCLPISGVSGSAPSCTATAKTGFFLEGWYVQIDGQFVKCSNVVDGKLTVEKNGGVYIPDTYYASFEEDQTGASDVTISFNVKTWDASGKDISADGYIGGSVSNQETKVHPASGKPESTATANSGFKFVKWVDAEGKDKTTDATIHPQWDPEKRIFVQTTYTAIFQELDAPVTINYKAKAQDYNGNLIDGFAGGSVSISSTTVTVVTGQPSEVTATASIDGFEFVGWYFWNPTDESLDYRTNTQQFQPSKGKNEIWVNDVTYVALFKEKQIDINYGVLTCSKDDLTKLYDENGGTIKNSVESVYPYSSNTSGSEVLDVYNGYHFLKWVKKTSESSYVDVGTAKIFVPGKDGQVYKPEEYFAVFTTYDVTIHVCVANEGSGYYFGDVYHDGQKVENEYTKTIESASKYEIDDEGTLSFYTQGSESELIDKLTVKAWDNCNYIGYVLNEQVSAASSFGVVYGTEEEPYSEFYKDNEYFISVFAANGKFWMSYEVAEDSKVGDSQFMGSVGLGQSPTEFGNNCHEEITAAAINVQGSTAKSNKGYTFDYWTIDNQETKVEDALEYIKPAKDGDIYKPHRYFAHFKENDPVTIEYSIDCDVDVVGVNPGSVSSPSESIKPASGTAKGSKASAAEGFEFAYWYYYNSSGEQIKINDQQLTPQKEEGVYVQRMYTAHFTQLNNVKIIYKVENKYDDIDPGKVALGNHPESGYATSVTEDNIASITGNLNGATARAFNGYKFIGWKTQSGKVVTDEYLLPQKEKAEPWASFTYIACFEELNTTYSYSVRTWNNDQSKEFKDIVGGSLDQTIESIQSVSGNPSGTNLTKNRGFIFDGWFDEAGKQVAPSSVEKFIPTKEGDQHLAYTSHQYYAKFHEEADVTISYKVKQLNEQSGDLWPGTIAGQTSTSQTLAPVSGKADSVTATSNYGYSFVGWFAEGSSTAASTAETFTPQKSQGVYSAITYNAVFKAENTNYKVRYWFQDYDKQNYSQRLDVYADKKYKDITTETEISDFGRYFIEGGVPGFNLVIPTGTVKILGSIPEDESTWTNIDIYYNLRDDMELRVNVYLQDQYVQGDVSPTYSYYEAESYTSSVKYTTGQWLDVDRFTYDAQWREYSWAYDFIKANTPISEDKTMFQIGENGTTISLYYKVIAEAKYSVNLYRDKVDATYNSEGWEDTPFETITDLKYYPNTMFKPNITEVGYDYTNSDEGKIIPGPDQPQPVFNVYLTRQTNIKYKLVYMIQDYDQQTGKVIPGQYHPAQDDAYYQHLVGLSDFTHIFSNGVTATKVNGANLSDEYWNRDLPGFTPVDKYDPAIEGDGWCTINGEGLENSTNADWWKGRNIIRRYYDKKYFTLNIHYVVPEGFDNPEYSHILPGDYNEYYHMVNESYNVPSPDLYSTLTLEPDREVVSGIMLADNISEIVTYHETKLIHIDNLANDASLGWIDEPTFEYGYYHGLHAGKTHDVTAHANDNAHFICWKNEAGDVVSTSPTLTLKREIEESDPKPVNGQDNENQILLSAKYTAVFEANETPSPDEPKNWDTAQTGDSIPMNLAISMILIAVLALFVFSSGNIRGIRKKKING